ncbi:hypothetical protein AB0M11_22875 [Streptomyces sp. NPDC051987]|uniref:hypothetical protein n=1 Tax=Streptomyces sp. NPDC051987 TaxID=3155808 RepID=UPI00342A60C6
MRLPTGVGAWPAIWVRPGSTVELGVTFGGRSVVWTLNGTQVFADGRRAGATELSFQVENLVVRRPAPPSNPAGLRSPGPGGHCLT